MICCCHLFLAVLQQAIQALDALITSDQLPLSNCNLLLQRRVLLDKLPLDLRELLEIALQERHLLLLRSVVGRPEDVVVLFASLVKRNLELSS
jgi:hypothetical protein